MFYRPDGNDYFKIIRFLLSLRSSLAPVYEAAPTFRRNTETDRFSCITGQSQMGRLSLMTILALNKHFHDDH